MKTMPELMRTEHLLEMILFRSCNGFPLLHQATSFSRSDMVSQHTTSDTAMRDTKDQFEAVSTRCPARARTAGAPAASSEAIFPSSSTNTPMGVPVAPNNLPMLMPA